MSQPYVGEIRIFAGNFAPSGWMFCDGQLMPISENETLFNLIGTTYGGDGQTTFALPDLRGRLPTHQGTGGGASYTMGQPGGVESVTLTTSHIPVHNHSVPASVNNASTANASGVVAQTPSYTPYFSVAPATAMANNAIGLVGGSQPHTNFQPYLCVNYIISLFGVYPSQI